MARINDSYRLTPTSWKHWDPDVRFVPVRPGRTLQLMRIYSMRDLRPSDLEEFEELVAPIQAALDAGLSFMKLSGRSTKSGEFGVRPIRTVLEALESIGSLKPFEFEESQEPEYLVFCHWRPIDREYRVFVRYGHIKAISQQRCREVLPDVEKHALADAALIGAWFHGIKLAFREAAIDVAITNNTPWLIEWNPPALWGQSGSSLLTETDLLSLLRSPLEPFSIPVFVRSAEPPPPPHDLGCI